MTASMFDLHSLELPEGWELVRLGYVARLQNGLTVDAKRDITGDVVTRPYLRVANVQAGSLDLGTVTEISVPRSVAHRCTLRPGDVLMTEGGDLDKLGRGTVWQGELEWCLHQNHVFAIRPDPQRLSGRYLAYLTQSLYGRCYFESTGTRTTNLASTNSSKIQSFPLPLPPVDEQRRIADYLDFATSRIDRMVRLERATLEKITERESAVLDLEIDALYQRAGSLPFRRFVTGVDQGSSPQCDAVPANDGEWGVLKVSALRPGTFDPTANKRLPEDVVPDRRSEVQEGDLLITRANTPQLVGSTAVVPRVRPKLMLSDKIFRVRVSKGLSPHYVAAVARGSRVRAACWAASNGASQSMANLRFEEIKEWPIPPVSLDEQHAFVDRVSRSQEAVKALGEKVEHQLSLLAERRQSLITAAVTGQLDVTTAR
ncbi:restriction endonuclease subunit S [Kitasatospora sp. NPDC056327]|uniref:restriction endonuclease subunit S n=1 Tax=Kitasatospora sp. NPDC056327 TaxID=3345785 RepID=UPI0035E06E16